MGYEELGAPQSRNEAILMNMLGATYEIGEPQSRIEYLLKEILEHGGGGGGAVSGVKGAVETTYRTGNVNLNIENIAELVNGLVYDPVTKKLGGTQYNTMPTASAEWEGKMIQYAGEDTADYENGHFYKCKNNGGTYEWEEAEIMDTLTQDQLNALISLL